MRIGIDARMLGPEQGGIGRYIEQLILSLEKISPSDEFFIFLRAENWERYQPHNPRFTKILAPYHWYGLAEQFLFPRLLQKHCLDLIHFPHWNIPLFYHGPFIVTIHDLLLWEFPTRAASTLGPLTYALKNQAYRRVLKHAAQKSTAIIAPSEFTKQDIVKKLNISPAKITVTYQAPFTIDYQIKSTETPEELLKRLGIHKPFIVYTGNAYPHKNLPRLLSAFKIFIQKYSPAYQLVLIGPDSYFYKQLKKTTLSDGNLTGKVIFPGFVSDAELINIYRAAALYVYPSLYEGFGLPPLEALAQNLPVAASSSTCLPEILGDAALFFDPRDPQSIAHTIYSGVSNSELRQKLLLNSRKLLRRYTWNSLAQKTLEIYRRSG